MKLFGVKYVIISCSLKINLKDISQNVFIILAESLLYNLTKYTKPRFSKLYSPNLKVINNSI